MEHKWIKILLILLCNAIFAFGIAAFIIPCGLLSGGTTGIALFVQHICGLPVVVTVWTINISMLLLGWFVFGKNFVLSTILSSVCYPLFLDLFQRLLGDFRFTTDILLSTLFAGLLVGAGVGLILRMGASSGGMDIPPLVLNKYTGISVSVFLYAFDTVILILQAFFSDLEKILYSIVVTLLTSLIINKVMLIGKSQVQVMIISEKYREINTAIQTTLDRGSTFLQSITGHLQKEQLIVFSILSPRELPNLNRIVSQIDPMAFMTVTKVNEVRGRGFTLKKHD
ncbi:MAG TPA: YitT family protein [Ruminococcaceae bacterium]|nr:YitT family protein [Oscillospiraceae bacterium]